MTTYQLNMNTVTQSTFEYAQQRLLEVFSYKTASILSAFSDFCVTSEEIESIFDDPQAIDPASHTHKQISLPEKDSYAMDLLGLDPFFDVDRFIHDQQQDFSFELNGNKIFSKSARVREQFEASLGTMVTAKLFDIKVALSDHCLTSAELFALWDANGNKIIDDTEELFLRTQPSNTDQQTTRPFSSAAFNESMKWFGLDLDSLKEQFCNRKKIHI